MNTISVLLVLVFLGMILLGILSCFINFGLTETQQFAFLLSGSVGYGFHLLVWVFKEAAQRGFLH